VIRAVVWKELREQGLIAIMLAVLGGGLLVATALLADPPLPGAPPTDVVRALGAARLVTLMLVVTAGLVCGGALFAAEKEAGTMPFLEALPSARWGLWRAKIVAGLVLAAIQVAVLLCTAAVLEVTDGAFARRLVVYALLAFAWGTLGSTLARTTLGSVGVAIPAATLATFVFLLPVYLFLSAPGSGMPRTSGWAFFQVMMLCTPLSLSAWHFTAPDRARAEALSATAVRTAAAPARRWSRGGLGLRALVWLTARQLGGPGTVLSAFALAFGWSMLLPDLRPVFVWPFLALTAGVLTGVLAFGDEQAHRSAPFWSEHRLPLGRAWWVKIAMSAGLLVWLLVLLALPGFLRAQFGSSRFGQVRTTFSAVFQSHLFDELGSQSWKYLLVPPAYGFALGHVCGLLFRKLVVACGVATLVGGAAAALWMPSLLAGGVAHWQVWVPPALVLLTGRVLLRGWTADRLADRGPLARAVLGGCTAALVLAAGIGYRAVQVPDDPGGGDDQALVAAQPTYDQNQGGRDFRSAAERFARVAGEVPETDRTAERPPPRLDERLEKAVREGRPETDLELSAWLDRVFSESSTGPDDKPWPVLVAEAAALPIGIYEPPQLVSTVAVSAAALDNARRMAQVLLARGLQVQANNNPGAFVEFFRIVVTLARSMRNGGGVLALERASEVERRALVAAERWLERLGPGAAKLPRTVAQVAAAADDPAPFDPRPYHLADRYVIRGMMQAPAGWLALGLAPAGSNPDRVAPEADLVAFAWSVPWEKERTRRLVGLAPEGLDRTRLVVLAAGRPGAGVLLGRNRSMAELTDTETLLRVLRRAVMLKCAIRAYQAEHGSAPPALEDLVTRHYLERVPSDPYADGHPFGYRVSAGETLRRPPRTPPVTRLVDESNTLTVQPGQVVFWSVGIDRVDQGGHVPPGGAREEDLVFVVPLPAQ
jgi:hypothetical protein